MADSNIVIKITSETNLDEAQKQMKALTDEADRQSEKMYKLKDARSRAIKSIKDQKMSEEDEAKAIKRVNDYFRAHEQALKKTNETRKNSIKELEKQIKAYKTLQGQSGKAVQQLRAMREELQRMEDAGEYGTQAFVDLSIKAAELEDQMGDLQQRIRILASDTKNMDAVMGLGDGLAGGFYIATSTAELFGGELEGLQQAFYKVQAAMSIVSGVQQVYNALQKDSAAMVVLNTAVSKLFGKAKKESAVSTAADAAASAADAGAKGAEAVATNTATKAQLKLNAAFLANPIGVVIAGVAAAVAFYYALTTAFGKAAKAARAARQAQKEYDKQVAVTGRALQTYAILHDQALHNMEKEETARLHAAKKRHASELEISQIELDALKEREKETSKYVNDAIIANNLETQKARELKEAKLAQLNTQKKGSKDYYKVLGELKDAEQQYYDVVQRGLGLEKERSEAQNAVAEKELEIAEIQRQLRKQTQDAQIELMRDGSAKQIAQINSNYDEQLRTIKGKSKEERALRKALIEKRDQEIADIERRSAEDMQKMLTEIDVKEMEERTKKLNGSEGVEKQLQVWNDYYEARKYQMEENARLEIEAINRSTDSEEVKAAKIEKINTELQAELADITKQGAEKRIEIQSQELTDLEIALAQAEDKVSKAQTGGQKINALKEQLDAQKALYAAQQKELEELWHNGDEKALISKEEYKKRQWEITKATTDAEVAYMQEKMQVIADGFQQALGYMQQVSDLAFEALGSQVQAELDALEEGYTTDYEEAQKNADKKYITEEQLAKKKAALEEKQAKYAKAQALINAAINTATAIVTTLAQLGATPWGIAASIIAGSMGAAQIGIIASKPLAQYAKGRNGGEGEYALVGEKGAEIMYVPKGASIIPHDKIADQEAWGRYGVPRFDMPDMPVVNADSMRFVTTTPDGRLTIDYDKLGEAVARNIPQQKAVTVNVDRSGVHVTEGSTSHTYLNKKYNGVWS